MEHVHVLREWWRRWNRSPLSLCSSLIGEKILCQLGGLVNANSPFDVPATKLKIISCVNYRKPASFSRKLLAEGTGGAST
jgi:hypothetical protein